MPGPQRIKIFRIEGGVRIPYTIDLDQEMTVIAEYADRTVHRHVVDGRRSHEKPRTPESPARKIALIMNRWVTKQVETNPIPGTEDLRDRYFDELAAMHTVAALEGSACKPCDISKLMRRYREILEQQGYFADVANLSLT